MNKKQIITRLLKNLDKETREIYSQEKYQIVNDENWTLADLFIRQYLNNGDDGFGMQNVEETYKFLLKIKNELIENNLISKNGRNNSGFLLWENYNFGGEAK